MARKFFVGGQSPCASLCSESSPARASFRSELLSRVNTGQRTPQD